MPATYTQKTCNRNLCKKLEQETCIKKFDAVHRSFLHNWPANHVARFV